MTTHKGQCHCGSITVEFESEIAAEDAELRECQCSFCRMHGAKAVADPNGSMSFAEITPGTLNRYRFGLNTADFIVCHNCGIYMGCILSDGDNHYGIVNIRALNDRAKYTSTPTAFDYDAETTSDRIARRKAKWTPAKLIPYGR